ncbi:MAG: NAD(P)H-hydrate dehydratase [Acidimicrobiia bacterium]|nr:NAD(P)H-hydrate dehydratase [Acidimicrobiia bacterium]
MNLSTNGPELWSSALPRPGVDDHKYRRGHAVVVGAPDLTGASRLAASACSRIGAGLVTLVAEERGDVYRTSLPADIMVSDDAVAQRRSVTALLLGPGGLPSGALAIATATSAEASVVLDAGALTSHVSLGSRFAHRVLTPHEGEFAVTFPDITGEREDRALAAAQRANAVVVLKGAETLISEPGGRVVRNTHASPYLAKAGSGDVLAGMITGLIAQGMDPFAASCAAVWMHGDAARRFGPGLIPDDLIDGFPAVLADLLGEA